MRHGINKQGKQKGNFGSRQGQGQQFCVCAHCGYSCGHQSGAPCRNLICPNCGLPLARMSSSGAISSGNQRFQGRGKNVSQQEIVSKDSVNVAVNSTNNLSHENETPHVDIAKCTACGTCVDVCRRGAISLNNGTAIISPDLCINCGLCIRKCPQGALS